MNRRENLVRFIVTHAPRKFAETIQQHSDLLTELDIIIGDGDHGINMCRGVKAVDELDVMDQRLGLSEILHQFGMTLVMSIGGASGPLYGSLFIGMSKAACNETMGLGELAELVSMGVDEVKKRGKSEAGEKTMLDVLVPVAEALKAISGDQIEKRALIHKIRKVAEEGFESTRPMMATKGRASYLKERSVGHLDPGAKSSQLFVNAVCDLADEFRGLSSGPIPIAETNEEIIFYGKTASEGCVTGLLDIISPPPQPYPIKGTHEAEQQKLLDAIKTARDQLMELVDSADELGAQILSVQVALLEDPELTEPIFGEIARGNSASKAWGRYIDQHINKIKKEEGYFSDRANDFADLKTRVIQALQMPFSQQPKPVLKNAIYLANDLVPSTFIATDWSNYCGIALKYGSTTNHVAMLAIAQGIPLLTNLNIEHGQLIQGEPAAIDSNRGALIYRPSKPTMKQIRDHMIHLQEQISIQNKYLEKPATTRTGDVIRVNIDINTLDNLSHVNPAYCDGIGLTRTELLFPSLEKLCDEETQFQSYLKLLKWAGGKTVTVRSLDAGGDKPIPGLTPECDANPFLGLRGIRLSLRRPEVFRVQLRAMARAAAEGPIRLLLPMVTIPQELETTKTLLHEELESLRNAGTKAESPEIGIMVELAAAALLLDMFQVDFFGIGCNDLIQYVTGISRDDANVSELYDPYNPAVLKLIKKVVDFGVRSGKEVCICGNAASDPQYLSTLIGLGVTSISVPPTVIGQVKAIIAHYPEDHGNGFVKSPEP